MRSISHLMHSKSNVLSSFHLKFEGTLEISVLIFRFNILVLLYSTCITHHNVTSRVFLYDVVGINCANYEGNGLRVA